MLPNNRQCPLSHLTYIHDVHTLTFLCMRVCLYENVHKKREKEHYRTLNTAGSIIPLRNETSCQCPRVGLCHQDWYLSFVQKMRRHVEHS